MSKPTKTGFPCNPGSDREDKTLTNENLVNIEPLPNYSVMKTFLAHHSISRAGVLWESIFSTLIIKTTTCAEACVKEEECIVFQVKKKQKIPHPALYRRPSNLFQSSNSTLGTCIQSCSDE